VTRDEGGEQHLVEEHQRYNDHDAGTDCAFWTQSLMT
jgi:hypothetical protein